MEERIKKVKDIIASSLNDSGLKEEERDDLKTMFHQDLLALKEVKEKGLDAEDSFRAVRLGEKEEKPYYHVFTTEGREEKVDNELRTMRHHSFFVDNESVPSYRKKRWEKILEPSLKR